MPARSQGMDPDVIYLLSWFRFDGLAAGAILAIWARTENFHIRSAVCWIAVALFISAPVISFTEAHVLSPASKAIAATVLRYTQALFCFSAFFIFVLIFRGTKWTAPLRLSFLQLSGALSYCLYLVHLSVGDLFEFLRGRQHSLSMGPTYIVWLRGSFLVFVSFGIALFTRKFLENPVLALKDRFTLPLRNNAVSLEPFTSRENVGLDSLLSK